MEPFRTTIEDSTINSKYREMSIPLVRCDGQIFRGTMKQERIEPDINNDSRTGTIIKTENLVNTTIETKIKIEKDFIEGYEFDGIVETMCNSSELKLCNKDFSSSYKEHTSQREEPFICDICHKSFIYKSNLRKHIMLHTQDNVFSQTSNLKNHISSSYKEHTSKREEPFMCDICHKSFNYKSNLRKHIMLHTQDNVFSQTSNLKTVKKPYKCNTCDRWFACRYKLTTHKRTHTVEKAYVCEVCDKRLTASYGLALHRRTHTGEKPYVCEVCDKGCTSSSDLVKHTRIHTGEKPYKCNTCDRWFACRSNLTKHTRTHTGEKPYVCEVCDKGFTSSSGLVRHTRIHTGEKTI